jgi:sulfate adenylyltransferase subunit 2
MTDHLDWLEDEGIDIIREACAGAANPVLMYSIGKDSSVRTSGRSFPKSRSL